MRGISDSMIKPGHRLSVCHNTGFASFEVVFHCFFPPAVDEIPGCSFTFERTCQFDDLPAAIKLVN